MKLLLITAGSRGDVEPFAALARAAVRAGHRVRLAVPERTGLVTDDLDVVSLGVDFTAMIEHQGVTVTAAARGFRRVVAPIMRGVVVNAARVAQDFRPHVVVAHPKVLSAPLIAEAFDIAHVLVEMAPAVTPTRAFPAAGTVPIHLGPFNPLTFRAAGAARAMFADAMDEAGRILGMSGRRRTRPPAATVLPISPALLDRPDDWPATVHLTGPWTVPRPGEALPPDVESFCSEGPFVYAGFGSMVAGDPVARGRALVAGARESGHRLLIATGLGGVHVPDAMLGDDVRVVTAVPHDLVLARAEVAVHHGGIGTVQAAGRAGTVSIIVPFIADQPFWGRLLHRRGLAPAPIPWRRVTAGRVAAALTAAPAHRGSAATLARRMSAEKGTAVALEVIGGLG